MFDNDDGGYENNRFENQAAAIAAVNSLKNEGAPITPVMVWRTTFGDRWAGVDMDGTLPASVPQEDLIPAFVTSRVNSRGFARLSAMGFRSLKDRRKMTDDLKALVPEGKVVFWADVKPWW